MKIRHLMEGAEPKLPGAFAGVQVMTPQQFVAKSAKGEEPRPEQDVEENSVVSFNDNPNTIKRLVTQFWTGDDSNSANAEKMLQKMGWEIYVDYDHDEI